MKNSMALKLKTSYFEKIESIELLRALENGFKMGSNQVKSNSFRLIHNIPLIVLVFTKGMTI